MTLNRDQRKDMHQGERELVADGRADKAVIRYRGRTGADANEALAALQSVQRSLGIVEEDS